LGLPLVRITGEQLPYLRHRRARLSGLILLGMLAVGWSMASAERTPHPGVQRSAAPSSSPAPELMANIFQEPKKYLDREVTVEGTLMGEGRGFPITFFLRHDSGARLEVNAWAPLEIPPQPPGKGRPPMKIMTDYVGKRLRLTGRLREQGSKIILQVASVAELP
jgi:hypothetical protein